MSTIRVTITLNPKTLRAIESMRGLIPRSRYIESILEKELSKKTEDAGR